MPKVLLVDDDPDLLTLLSMGFEASGFSVSTANNGTEALRQARALPDVMILDLGLPEVDGFTVCQTLKRDRATAAIPIILLTGLAGELGRYAGLECGANDYVAKPVALDTLIARAKKFLVRSGNRAPAHSRADW